MRSSANKIHYVMLTLMFITKGLISTEADMFESEEQKSVYSFLIDLIHIRFADCALIVLEDQYNTERNLDYVLQGISIGKYFIKFDNSSQDFNSSVEYPLQFPFKLSKIRKYSSNCVVSAVFLEKVGSEDVLTVAETIAPKFMPMIRKDEEHFVFVTPEKYHEQLLLEDFVHRTKFKLAVGLSVSDNSVVGTTVDFFGGPKNAPLLVKYHINEMQTLEGIDFFPDFLWNLKGAVIKIVLPQTVSFVEADPAIPVNNGIRGRWLYLFEEYLMPKFNFTYFMFMATDKDGKIGQGATGFQLKNGTWVGMTGDLLYHRADLGLAFANTPKRAPFIAFTDQFFDYGCLTYVTGQPAKVFSTTAILWPFNIGSWLCIIGCCIAGMIFLLILASKLRVLNLEKSSLSFPAQMRILLAPFIEQDFTVEPVSHSLRSFIIYWSLFAIVITCLYRSKLVTLLAFPVLEKLPETFEDLAFSGYQIGFMKHGDSAYNTLKASTDSVYVTLIRKMEVITGVGLNCLENAVNNAKYGCIAYNFDVTYLIERNLTDIDARKFVIATNGRTYNVFLGLGTETYSKYKVNFGKALGITMPMYFNIIWSKMDEYYNIRLPKLKYWRDTNQTDKLQTSTDNGAPEDELTLQHILGVFYIFFGCVILSSLVFSVELMWKKMPRVRALFQRKRTKILF